MQIGGGQDVMDLPPDPWDIPMDDTHASGFVRGNDQLAAIEFGTTDLLIRLKNVGEWCPLVTLLRMVLFLFLRLPRLVVIVQGCKGSLGHQTNCF